jgi:sec-independent protein translocase protein TatC
MSEESSIADAAGEKAESFVSHLVELRNRLLSSVKAVLIVFIPAAIFSRELFTLLAEPMLAALSTSGTMISTEVAGPFLVPLKFAFALSIAVAIPYLLFQIWAFIAPGLYENEKRLAFPLLLTSTLLFYCGIAFAYFVVFPIMFGFFPSVAPIGIEVTPDINHYLGFVLKLFFAFGIAFEIPIATILLIKAGVTTREKLATKRAYVVIGAFVVGMLLTPPDIFSQTMLAVPMLLLFELGLIMSKFVGSPKKDEESDENAEDSEGTEENENGENPDDRGRAGDDDKAETDENNNIVDDDAIVPGVMPQQAASDDDEKKKTDSDTSNEAVGTTGAESSEGNDTDDEEEDLDKLAEELDQLEDISSWVQPGEDEADQSREDEKDQSSKHQGDQSRQDKKKPDESETGSEEEPDKKDS